MGGAGRNADQINISLPKAVADEIKQRSKAMGLSASRYCYLILTRHLHEGRPLVLSEASILREQTDGSGLDNSRGS
ncbi:MAG: hypothetical protein WC360_00320 [Opitutales bacterium]|jgi:hypothetical protein